MSIEFSALTVGCSQSVRDTSLKTGQKLCFVHLLYSALNWCIAGSPLKEKGPLRVLLFPVPIDWHTALVFLQ